jgi:D-xylose 1-dehydrogenase (NADP+, D-xylono-1,5-lactone-forming)
VPVRWGVLGAAWIAEKVLLQAIREAEGCELSAIAARSPERARELAGRFGARRVHEDYAALLADPEVDAVYLPLPNSLHLPWTQRALAAGKHVLCEKPLAMNATEAAEMAESSRSAGRLLMEAAMYRFSPRMRRLVAELGGEGVRHVSAAFTFTIDKPGNYRLRPELGGGALLDVGFYTADVARWLLGEPERVEAVVRGRDVDMSCSALLSFAGGAQAALYASFEAAEHQEVVVVRNDRVERVDFPFTGGPDPVEQYRVMVEEFSEAVRTGAPVPLPLESSIANMRLLDRIRDAAG